MNKIVLVVVAIMAMVGCGGDNITGGPSTVVCFSGGKQISEFFVKGIVYRGASGFSFDVDGRAVNVNADCIVQEQR